VKLVQFNKLNSRFNKPNRWFNKLNRDSKKWIGSQTCIASAMQPGGRDEILCEGIPLMVSMNLKILPIKVWMNLIFCGKVPFRA